MIKWELRKSEKNIDVTPGKSSINELLISPFGNYIAYSSDKYIYMIDREGKLLWRSEFHNLLAFSKNEKLLLMKAEDFLVVDGQSGNRIVCFNLGLVRIPFMNSPVLSQDGRAVAIVAASRNIGEKDNFYILKLFGKEAQIIFEGDYPFNFIRKSQFSTDSKQLCFVGKKGSKLSVYKLIFSNKK